MHRFYLSPAESAGPILTLAGAEAHHALRVLRLRRGDRVAVLDGAGGEYECEIGDQTRDSVGLRLVNKKHVEPPSCPITLVQGVPKGRLIENIIQKATELGAARIVPLLTERVVTKLDLEKSAHKAEHWRSVAIEAIKQCGSPWLPKIDPPMALDDFVARGEKFDLSLIGSLRPGSRHPREWFVAFSARHQRNPDSICVWVGPEGDFTDAEILAVQASGAKPITLGRQVLRCETAATYCLSVINYELQAPREPGLISATEN